MATEKQQNGGKDGKPGRKRKKVPKFKPRPDDVPLTAEELNEGELTEQDVHDALARTAARFAELDPDLAGILDAETENEEREEPAE